VARILPQLLWVVETEPVRDTMKTVMLSNADLVVQLPPT
jgi:hypothetical protein